MISVSITYPSVETRPDLYRVKHDTELGLLWREQLPQVHPVFPNHFSPFRKEWQLLSKKMNPLVSGEKWTACYGNATWMTNGQGFGKAGDPRANYVLNENIATPPVLPKVEMLTCGGNLLAAKDLGGDWVLVNVLDYRIAPPEVDWMFAHPWHITWATRCGLNIGQPVYLLQAKDANGDLVPFAHPQIGDEANYAQEGLVFPKWKLQKWVAQELPSPYKFYL